MALTSIFQATGFMVRFEKLSSRVFGKSVFIFALLAILGACATIPVQKNDQLKKNLLQEITSLQPEEGIWGSIIIDLDEKDTLLLINPDLAFKPASITKLFTVAAASQLLPHLNFASMQINKINKADSTVDSLYWIGAGLPLAGQENIDSLFESGLRKLEKSGIKYIKDALVIVDPTDNESQFPGWTMEDASAWFASKPALTSSKSNLWEVTILRVGDSLTYEILPDSPFKPAVDLRNSEEFFYRWTYGEYQIPYLYAGLPADQYRRKIFIPMLRPIFVWGQRFKEKVIAKNLADDSIDLNYIMRFPLNKPLVMSYPVLDLDSLFLLVNKYTDNFTAESLLRIMGLNAYGVYGRESGLSAVDSVLINDNFVKDRDYKFWDGSGMSRYNWVTPSSVNKLLISSYYKKSLESSLAVSGQPGTLKNRLGSFPPNILIRGKTGSMNGVRNFCGFMTLPNGHNFLVIIFVNQYTLKTKEIDSKMRRILLHIIYSENNLKNLS